jgi:hypothetical protein
VLDRGREIAVVDPAGLDLVLEPGREVRSVSSPGCRSSLDAFDHSARFVYLDDPVQDVHGIATQGRGAALVPGLMATLA